MAQAVRTLRDVLRQRTDISKFLVHLTRDTSSGTAKENLISILTDGEIKAYDHHCLFSDRLDQEDERLQKRFHVVCFTETPLDKVYLLTGPMKGRQKEFQPYGVAFRKETVSAKNGNPAVYVYGENKPLIQYLWNCYDAFAKSDEWAVNDFPVLGRLVNIVNKRHDFYWEREWRVPRGFKFKRHEILAVIAPEPDHEDIYAALGRKDILVIDAAWNMEEIVEHLSDYLWDNVDIP